MPRPYQVCSDWGGGGFGRGVITHRGEDEAYLAGKGPGADGWMLGPYEACHAHIRSAATGAVGDLERVSSPTVEKTRQTWRESKKRERRQRVSAQPCDEASHTLAGRGLERGVNCRARMRHEHTSSGGISGTHARHATHISGLQRLEWWEIWKGCHH
jgi:hypothetical protein